SNSHAGLVLGHTEAHACDLARAADNLQAVLWPVNATQPLIHVHQPDHKGVLPRAGQHLANHLAVHADAVVVDADAALATAVLRRHHHAPRTDLTADPVANGILDEGWSTSTGTTVERISGSTR